MKFWSKRSAAWLLSAALTVSQCAVGALAVKFEDVSSSNPAYDAIAYLADHAFTQGVSASDFNPEGVVDTAQVVTFLSRMLGVDPDGYSTSLVPELEDDGWSTGYVVWAVTQEILPDVKDLYAPLTESEINILLERFSQALDLEVPEVKGNTRGDFAVALAKMHQDLQIIRGTEYGPVKGINQDGVQIYYGIPYGANPVDELRWAPPVVPEAWTEVRDCTEKEPRSLQMGTITKEDGTTEPGPVGTTDCLNLDVYTTADAEKLPVLVYIHGGNNQSGSSYSEFSGKDLPIWDDCVVVSLNYRTGLLGYNCLPAILSDENPSGNFGLMDIALALQWVQDNITEFGGDPSNVTVSGLSAGGRNVMAMLISPMFEGLFKQAIAFSGGMTVCDVDQAAAKDAEIMAGLAVEDGKAETLEEAQKWLMGDNDEVREYLFGLDVNRLTYLMTDAGIRMSKFPHLFGDDVTLPSDGFDGGKYINDVPVIMLTGTTEFSGFCASDAYYNTLEGEELQRAARDFAISYGSDFYRIFNTQLSAEKMAGKYQSNVYLWQLEYGGATSPTKFLYPGFEPSLLGAFHGVFVPAVGTENQYDGVYADFSGAGFAALRKDFNIYLKNFLYTGDPNHGETVPTEWVAWDADTKLTLIMDADDEAGTSTSVMKNVFKSNAEIIAEIEADDTLPDDVKAGVISTVMNGRWFSDDLDEHFGTPSLW